MIFKRTAKDEICVTVAGVVIPVVNASSWRVASVISSEVLNLTGASFERFKDILRVNTTLIEGFTKIAHGYYNDPENGPADVLTDAEFGALLAGGVLTREEVVRFAADVASIDHGTESRETTGQTHIYLIQDRVSKLVKIGQSQDPHGRLKELIRQDTLLPTPNDFELIAHWYAPGRVEKELHRRFADKRRRGEWFELTDEDLERICGLLKQKYWAQDGWRGLDA